MRFQFKALAENNFDLLHRWLNQDHVARYWDKTQSLEAVQKRYSSYIISSYIFPYIIEQDEHPIGFFQSYRASKIGEGWWENYDDSTWGIDAFIADTSKLNKGIGSQFLKEFSDGLLLKPEVSSIISDPSPENFRAIRAYEKAGFSKLKNITTPDGPALLMLKK